MMCRHPLPFGVLALVLACMAGPFCTGLRGADNQPRIKLTLLYTNNNYGYIEPCG